MCRGGRRRHGAISTVPEWWRRWGYHAVAVFASFVASFSVDQRRRDADTSTGTGIGIGTGTGTKSHTASIDVQRCLFERRNRLLVPWSD